MLLAVPDVPAKPADSVVTPAGPGVPMPEALNQPEMDDDPFPTAPTTTMRLVSIACVPELTVPPEPPAPEEVVVPPPPFVPPATTKPEAAPMYVDGVKLPEAVNV